MAQTLEQFVAQTVVDYGSTEQQPPTEPFEICHEKFLKVNMSRGLNEKVWIKKANMVACSGELKFEKENVLEYGFWHAFKHGFKAAEEAAGDVVRASLVSPTAHIYLADEHKHITLLRLDGDALVVNGCDLLAFELTSITHKITRVKKFASIVPGGLYNVRLEGHGSVAVLTHGKPIALPVAIGNPSPVFTDPRATVAWSGNLTTDFDTDTSFKAFFGLGSGESSSQMKFLAPIGVTGFVVVQPFDDRPSVLEHPL